MRDLISTLRSEKNSRNHNGIYHRLQIDFAYNSNHIEGSRLTHEQTKYIFDTKTIGFDDVDEKVIRVNDIVETINHFKCFDYIIDTVSEPISEQYIKNVHAILKNGIYDNDPAVVVGDYKIYPNEVGLETTTPPEQVAAQMNELIKEHDSTSLSLYEIADFHAKFEKIHPFYDGNGRVGRMVAFKQCLANDIVPFYIDDFTKMFYYKGLQEWNNEQSDERLINVFLSAQDSMENVLKYFQIDYVRTDRRYEDVVAERINKSNNKRK